ncbi:SAV_915 family protein [Kribbella sp. NPDC051770]|uniref:SAV_915 family protein n=1 Tax=Kribbella sp. NPDC051770 TaxID=3155413 RepID=UPI0034233784
MTTPLFVPTRTAGAWDVEALRIGRRPDGVRVGIAFTSLQLLRSTCGEHQDWMRVGEQELHDVLAELGVDTVQLDPTRIGPQPRELVNQGGR